MACTSGKECAVMQTTLTAASKEMQIKSESLNFYPDTTAPKGVASSLPACTNWPGMYNFNVSFGPQEKTTKGSSWTYSKIKDKLYVRKGVPCPIHFSTDYTVPEDTKVRTMAVFSQSEYVSEIVQRCMNHSLPDATSGHPAPEHLIRCECLQATYDVDTVTGRHSVIVPYENPQAGDSYSTYIFKFVCWGSCAGGLNRRPITVIFTLEKSGEVIGRHALEVRICACPGRDRRTDENQIAQLSQATEISHTLKRENSDETDLATAFHFIKGITYPPCKKQKFGAVSKDGFYVITVSDYKLYQFLEQMKKFYELCNGMHSLKPDLKKKFQRSYSKQEMQSVEWKSSEESE